MRQPLEFLAEISILSDERIARFARNMMSVLASEQADKATRSAWDVEVFFDGECPLCRREIGMLRRWDRRNRIRFTNIADEGFDANVLGVSHERLMEEIHGRLGNGSWIIGVEVFRRLYTAVGLGWLVAVTRWPGVSGLLECTYRVFARNRLRWTGRCTSDCRVR